jgi:ribonuclease Z
VYCCSPYIDPNLYDYRMQADYLLLNHFSQRYPKLPRLQAPIDNASGKRPVIALAFDLMTLPLSSFWKMENYTDALEELFVEVEGAESETAPSEAGDATTERAKDKGKTVGQAKVNGKPSEMPKANKRKRERGQPSNGKIDNGVTILSEQPSEESRSSKRSKDREEGFTIRN